METIFRTLLTHYIADGTISMEPSKVNGFRPLVDLGKRDDVDAEVPILVLQSLAALAAHPGTLLCFFFISRIVLHHF
jgi:hypothetical protein